VTGKTVAAFSMSLDGFIAASDDTVPHIFDWYDNGEVRFEWPGNDMVSEVTPASAAYLRELVDLTGALVTRFASSPGAIPNQERRPSNGLDPGSSDPARD
jgi:hypothetical protein